MIETAIEQATQLTSRKTICALCKNESHQQFLLSASSVGSPDLDSRPAGPARNATINAIQQCPICGYCSREIDVARETAASVVAGDEYQTKVTVPTLFVTNTKWHRRSIVLATQWHGLSLIQEAGAAFADAGWSTMAAAWVYDDAKLAQPAKDSRLRAIGLFRRAQELNETFAAGLEMEAAILADLSRRTDEFGAALAYCDLAERGESSVELLQTVAFQRELTRRRDTRCHNVGESGLTGRVRR